MIGSFFRPQALGAGEATLAAGRYIAVDEALDLWLRSSAPGHKRSTHSTYETVAERHIRPALGGYGVSALSPELLAGFLRDKASGDEALAPSTVCSIVTVLRSVFRCAESMGCSVAAWGGVSRPALVTGETEVLSAAEQERLESYLRRDLGPERLGVLLCLYTGLRLGEICALKWGDVASDFSAVTVRRTVQRIRNPERGGSRTIVVFDAPKSRRSNRTIPLPAFLRELLRQNRRPADCYFLTGTAERFIEPRGYQNRFKTMLRHAGVREINFHAIRHTFATNCVELGFDVKALSEILGHADVCVTLNTYVHPSMARMRSYMELFDKRESGE